MSNGNIQGIFLQNGNITFIKHYIQTEKLLFENKYGELPNNIFIQTLCFFLHKLKLAPDLLNVANTAFMKIDNQLFALFERDTPYLLDLNFQKKTLETIKKINIFGVTHFSAHSKVATRQQYNQIETIDYDVFKNNVVYYLLNEQFKTLQKIVIPMKHLPIIHDFIITDHKIILADVPLSFSFHFKKIISLILNKKKNTDIYVIDKNTTLIETFNTNESFYIFHYANFIEDDENMFIFASCYDALDFTEFNLSGKYRKIILHKQSKKVTIEKNNELENYCLDFPIYYDNKVAFSITDGVLICEGLNIIHKIEFKESYVCGEPIIHFMDGTPFLFTFTFDKIHKNKSNFVIINLITYKIIEVPLNQSLNVGFHSIFIGKK
jgi:carotenoid cleavage dioxygenase-like enzyme